ncbi:MAG TPA: tRNA epoxyqueuosine(34) reductase QueG [Candidatus Acidoferrales bacterium]|nr:tRNA epoxyqueuosine(34) reductase QueG [Candidatus Acidoferrales bacterium]
MSPEAVKARAIETARRYGAGAVAVAPAFPDGPSRARMRASLRRGDLATWRYGDEYARAATDPSTLLPGARSVICVAMPYATPAPAPARALRGRVSNYAWSTDYHPRMRALLSAIAGCVDDAAGRPCTAVACDTRPLAERAFAARSGLAWIGKHTNAISPAYGSFVFLGEVVTTLELPPDAPLRKTCGGCRRCVDACPTGALRGDYTIDATRCISDLTQRRDGIPRELRPLVGDWVWGCDLCQLACPPTQNAGDRGTALDRPVDADTARPPLVDLVTLGSGAFKQRYAGTAMGWRGAAVLRRNAAVALGNALDRSSVGALLAALEGDPSPMVRGHAAWALGRIGSPDALSGLARRVAVEEHGGVREEIHAALCGNTGGR